MSLTPQRHLSPRTLQRVMDNPRFLLAGECDPLRAGDRVRVYGRRAIRQHLSARDDYSLQMDA
jgi:hypothetical protein